MCLTPSFFGPVPRLRERPPRNGGERWLYLVLNNLMHLTPFPVDSLQRFPRDGRGALAVPGARVQGEPGG